MKQHFIRFFTTIFFVILLSFQLSAQDFIHEQALYKGAIDGKNNVVMFLSVENPCGGTPYVIGMYKYENQDEWIQLSISHNEKENRYCMVEYLFTGVMMLKKNSATLEGIWISPDALKQVPVKLSKKTLSNSEKARYLEIMEQLFYSHNDC